MRIFDLHNHLNKRPSVNVLLTDDVLPAFSLIAVMAVFKLPLNRCTTPFSLAVPFHHK